MTLELSRRLFDDDSSWEPLYYYGYYSRRLLDFDAARANQSAEAIRFARALRFIRSNYTIKKLARRMLNFYDRFMRHDAALYWEPNHILLGHVRARKKLLTVHDLSCILYPQWHPRERLDFWRANFQRGAEKADMIVTVSDTIRASVAEYTGVPEERVKFVHNGVDHELFRPLPAGELADFRARHNLPERYFLCVGSLEPRKNLKNLLSAWLSLPRSATARHKLLLIANDGWKNGEIMELIRRGEESGAVILIKNAAFSDLPFYYNLAEMFMYLSFYEGFGLPPLEAMACGTPVLVSDIPVHREILADAAAYVEPGSADIIAQRLEDLLINPPGKDNASGKRAHRASLYSWDKSAEAYAAIMKDLRE
ncbi:glycosyl transferase [Synergistales bacterium]|nr:glycosyl transferase [Synergistales bacterium]